VYDNPTLKEYRMNPDSSTYHAASEASRTDAGAFLQARQGRILRLRTQDKLLNVIATEWTSKSATTRESS
jgi:hypothetical protein